MNNQSDERVHLGTWVGISASGIITAGHAVYTGDDEAEAEAFVAAGSRRTVRLPAGVKVRLGSPYDPEPQPGDGPDYHEDHAAWERRQPSLSGRSEGSDV